MYIQVRIEHYDISSFRSTGIIKMQISRERRKLRISLLILNLVVVNDFTYLMKIHRSGIRVQFPSRRCGFILQWEFFFCLSLAIQFSHHNNNLVVDESTPLLRERFQIFRYLELVNLNTGGKRPLLSPYFNL